MGDGWTDRLSEYVDDELTPRERAAVDAHLHGCADCAALVTELRAVARRAGGLQDTLPDHDLWPGIEARLGDAAGVRAISLVERRRRFAFTMPRLAAAGLALVATSSAIVWLTTRPSGRADERVAVNAPTPAAPRGGAAPAVHAPATHEPGTPSEGMGPAPAFGEAAEATPRAATGDGGAAGIRAGESAPRLASAREERQRRAADVGRPRFASSGALDPRVTNEYDRAVADLEAVLRRGRSHLRPETIAVVEKSLHVIDRAISDARRALAKDPANDYLNDHLAESMRFKLELLRQTAALTQS